MFKITESPEFTHKVVVPVPVDGGFKDETLMARFRVTSQDRLAEIADATPGNYAALVDAIVVSLDDLADGDGKPLPYNAEVRKAVLDLPYVRTALIRAYSEAVSGARRGN